MAYGRYMIQNQTMIPDHTLYTWTPTDGSATYCAWVAEIFLYLLYQLGGLSALFAFRYLCLLTFVLVAYLYARRVGVASHPLTWFIILLGLLMAYLAVDIKPALFSFLFMTLLVATRWKLKSVRKHQWWYCYLIPLVMMVWANSHGGFIFGMAFLVVMGLGEVFNSFLTSGEPLAHPLRRHLWIAISLSFLAILITPYGWTYLLQLGQMFWSQSVTDLETVFAYLSIFTPGARQFHFVQYLVVAALILVGLSWHRIRLGKLDWSLLLLNVAFAFLYARFLRTTSFWAPIFVFSAIQLLAYRPAWLWPSRKRTAVTLGGVVVICSMFLAGRAGF